MRLTEEQVKMLTELRQKLQKRVEKLRRLIKFYEELIKAIDTIIRTSSITTAAQVYEETKHEEELSKQCLDVKELEDRIEIYLKFPLKKDDWRFRRYLVSKFLNKFKSEDLERIRNGEIDEEYAFDYEVVTKENGTIECIRLWNCDSARLSRIVKALQQICIKVREGS